MRSLEIARRALIRADLTESASLTRFDAPTSMPSSFTIGAKNNHSKKETHRSTYL